MLYNGGIFFLERVWGRINEKGSFSFPHLTYFSA